MSLFSYKAVDQQGKTIEGELESTSREDLASYLSKKGIYLLSVKERDKEDKKIFQNKVLFAGSLSLIDRQVLFQDLATMLQAGLPISDALKILREDAEKPALQKVLMDFQFTIEKGDPLSVAMEHYPNYFSAVVTNLTKAGETSGNLERTMGLIAEQYRRESTLKKRIVGAMVYPMVLLTLSVFVIIFLLIFVVPKLSQFFTQASIKLPFITRVIVALGNAVSGHIFLDILALIGFIALIVTIRKSPGARELFFEAIARFPLTRKLFRQLTVYRYCWTMGVLISSGVDILQSIEITRNVIVGKTYRAALNRVKSEVSKGTGIGEALKKEGKLFPNIVSGMTVVGEKTGELEHIYLSLAKFYDRNFSSALKTVVSLLEPLLLVLMGGVVGAIALSIVLPIYQYVAGGVK